MKFNQGSKFDRLKNVPRRQDRRTLNARYRRKMDRYIGRIVRYFSQESHLSVWKILDCSAYPCLILDRKLICCILASGSLLLSLGLFCFLCIYRQSIIIWFKSNSKLEDIQDINVEPWGHHSIKNHQRQGRKPTK